MFVFCWLPHELFSSITFTGTHIRAVGEFVCMHLRARELSGEQHTINERIDTFMMCLCCTVASTGSVLFFLFFVFPKTFSPSLPLSFNAFLRCVFCLPFAIHFLCVYAAFSCFKLIFNYRSIFCCIGSFFVLHSFFCHAHVFFPAGWSATRSNLDDVCVYFFFAHFVECQCF